MRSAARLRQICVRVARRRATRLLLLLGAMVAIAACQADVQINVTVEEDGSGVVETVTTLDAEASAAVLDLDREGAGLPLNDLVLSGWDVGRPEQAADGSTVVVASKAFGTTEQFSDVMSEITGDAGVIRNFRLFRTKTFARVDYRVVGTLDTTEGLGSFGDDALVRTLGDDLDEIAAAYGLDDTEREGAGGFGNVELEFELILPGQVQGEPPANAIAADTVEPRATWRASLAEPGVTTIGLESATREVSALVLRGVAVVAAVLAGLVVFAQILRILLPDRRKRPQRRRVVTAKPPADPSSSASADAGTGPGAATGGAGGATDGATEAGSGADSPGGEASAGTDPEATAEGERRGTTSDGYRVVALGGRGVLYRRAEDAARVLIPFARERAARMTDDEIEAKARLLELGRITTGQFWASIGVDGDPDVIDAEYLARLQLTPGVVKYLRSLRDRGVKVACVTNDAAEWAAGLKAAHSLESLIEPWVISGMVGVRKPDKPIFEVVRRKTGEPPAAILIVDDDLDVLDAARDLGYGTAWFAVDGTKELAREHTIIRRFDEVDDEVPEAESTV